MNLNYDGLATLEHNPSAYPAVRCKSGAGQRGPLIFGKPMDRPSPCFPLPSGSPSAFDHPSAINATLPVITKKP
jgi:hypothetical protein